MFTCVYTGSQPTVCHARPRGTVLVLCRGSLHLAVAADGVPWYMWQHTRDWHSPLHIFGTRAASTMIRLAAELPSPTGAFEPLRTQIARPTIENAAHLWFVTGQPGGMVPASVGFNCPVVFRDRIHWLPMIDQPSSIAVCALGGRMEYDLFLHFVLEHSSTLLPHSWIKRTALRVAFGRTDFQTKHPSTRGATCHSVLDASPTLRGRVLRRRSVVSSRR